MPSGADLRSTSDKHNDRGKPKPPSQAYRNYDHSTDAESRTYQEINQRKSLVLNAIIALVVSCTFVVAFRSYNETKRQADLASWALKESGRPAIFVSVEGAVANPETMVDFKISNIASNPAIVRYIELHMGDEPERIFKTTTECYVSIGDQVIAAGDSIHGICSHVPSQMAKAPMHFYGIVGYRSVGSTRWTRNFDYFWVRANRSWVESGDASLNRDFRTDNVGIELKEPD